MAKGTVTLSLRQGWSVVSVRIVEDRRGTRGRTHSFRPWTWAIALRGPRNDVRRAAGRARTPESAAKQAQRAAWTLCGGRGALVGRGSVPGRRSRRAPLVVVECAGELWTAGSRATAGSDAVRSVTSLGLPVRPGDKWNGAAARLGWASGAIGAVDPGDVPQEERGTRCVWVVRVSRKHRDQVRKLATQARPPLGPDKPFRPPVLSRWTVPRPSHAPDDDAQAGQDAGDEGAWGQ